MLTLWEFQEAHGQIGQGFDGNCVQQMGDHPMWII